MQAILAAALVDAVRAGDSKGPVVADGLVVSLHYTLSDPSGEVLRDTRVGAPLVYVRGRARLPVGIERAVDGLAVGQRVRVVLPPEQAYGLRKTAGPLPVPRTELPGGRRVVVGKPYLLERAGRAPVQFWVTRVERQQVWIDTDHPLAGRTLVLDAEVIALRRPTPAEATGAVRSLAES